MEWIQQKHYEEVQMYVFVRWKIVRNLRDIRSTH